MAWTPPKQFVEGEILTAADLNTYLRDNLLENEVMKATTAGSRLSTDVRGDIVERTIGHDVISDAEGRVNGVMVKINPNLYEHYSGPYNIGKLGPTVTIETGTRAIAFMSSTIKLTVPDTINDVNFTGIGVDCVTSPSSRLEKIGVDSLNTPINQSSVFWMIKSLTLGRSAMCIFSGLTPGPNTFTMRYFVGGPTPVYDGGTLTGWKEVTTTFSNRRLMILPL